MNNRSMRRKPVFLAFLLTGFLVLAACGRGGSSEGSDKYPDPGISDKSITLGSSLPLSGPASAYGAIAAAHKAYIKYVNEELGGVDGRKVKYVVYDDAYDPARTVENARRLVDKDQVLGIFGVIGTPTNLAIREYLNQEKVPQLFVGSAETKLGSDKDLPWTMGMLPAFTTEASILTAKMLEDNPAPKVAILYQNDDFGAGILNAFEAAFKGTGVELVGKASYDVTDPTVDSQVVNLEATGADVLISWTNPKQASQSIKKAHAIGWEPTIYISSAATSVDSVLLPAGAEAAKDVRSTFYTKDPSDPQWDDDPEMLKYKEIMTKYGSNVEVTDQIAVLGYVQAQLMIKTIDDMKKPSRQGLLDSATSLSDVAPGMALPGITVTTGTDDYFPFETEQIQSFDGKRWQPIGEPVSLEGKTPKVEK